jgi:hypothetical protein
MLGKFPALHNAIVFLIRVVGEEKTATTAEAGKNLIYLNDCKNR